MPENFEQKKENQPAETEDSQTKYYQGTNQRTDWQLPDGVSRGTWEYTQTKHIANDYDATFEEDRLFQYDKKVLAETLTEIESLIDFGCGTGRNLIPFAMQGIKSIGVDLSIPMLQVAEQKAAEANVSLQCIVANLVHLDCIQDNLTDAAICMFSTSGMIQGKKNRASFFKHVHRILKPNGTFILHVHNRWHNLLIPSGRKWLLQSLVSSLKGKTEFGDKTTSYRGLPNMFLHIFSKREIKQALHSANFKIEKMIPLSSTSPESLQKPFLLEALRANGWIIVCRAK